MPCSALWLQVGLNELFDDLFWVFSPPRQVFFIFFRISSRLKSCRILLRWPVGTVCRAELLWSDAAMSSLSLRAPLFTSICGEIGNWNWPCHCLPWPLIWVSFTFSHTPLVFLSEHSWLQQRLMSPDMWVKHRDRGWILKRQHPFPPLPAVHVSPTRGHAGGRDWNDFGAKCNQWIHVPVFH